MSRAGRRARLALLALTLLLPGAASAHAGAHARLAALDRAIARAPADAALRLERAELRARHGDLDGARRDFSAAAELGAAPATLLCRRGVALASLAPEAALADLSRCLAARPDHVPARAARAALPSVPAATCAADLARLAARLERAAPDLYLDWSRCRLRADAGRPDGALAALDAGLAALGPIATLTDRAIELLLDAERPREALLYLLALPAREREGPARRLQESRLRRLAGDRAGALRAHAAARAGFEALPYARRGTRAGRALELALARERAALARSP